MPQYLDYGLIKSGVEMPDGSIRIYGRVAKVGTMPYFERDSSGALVKIIREVPRTTLFDAASTDTLKLLDITNDHTATHWPDPDHRDQVVGVTGNLVVAGLDNEFLGVVGAIKTRDGIEAYKAGKRQLSPGYLCDLDGNIQMNRRYRELAIVDRARGGPDVRIKDSADSLSYCDPEYFSEDNRRLWLADGIDAHVEKNLLIYGTIGPPTIHLPSTVTIEKPQKDMTLIKAKIGDRELQIDPTSAQDAADVNVLLKDHQATQQKVKDQEQQISKLTAELAVVKDEAATLKAASANRDAEIKAEAAKMVKALGDAQQEIKLFEAAGKDTSLAARALKDGDLEGYRAAAVATYGQNCDYTTLVNVLKDRHPEATKDAGVMYPNFYIAPAMNGSAPMSTGSIGDLFSPGMMHQLPNGLPAPDDQWIR